MDEHIERILRQIPGWASRDAVVSPLVGGITNQNYRVDMGDESFVLRIGGKGDAPAGHRAWARTDLYRHCRTTWRGRGSDPFSGF